MSVLVLFKKDFVELDIYASDKNHKTVFQLIAGLVVTEA